MKTKFLTSSTKSLYDLVCLWLTLKPHILKIHPFPSAPRHYTLAILWDCSPSPTLSLSVGGVDPFATKVFHPMSLNSHLLIFLSSDYFRLLLIHNHSHIALPLFFYHLKAGDGCLFLILFLRWLNRELVAIVLHCILRRKKKALNRNFWANT